jgi:hypothetical protein
MTKAQKDIHYQYHPLLASMTDEQKDKYDEDQQRYRNLRAEDMRSKIEELKKAGYLESYTVKDPATGEILVRPDRGLNGLEEPLPSGGEVKPAKELVAAMIVVVANTNSKVYVWNGTAYTAKFESMRQIHANIHVA